MLPAEHSGSNYSSATTILKLQDLDGEYISLERASELILEIHRKALKASGQLRIPGQELGERIIIGEALGCIGTY